MPKDKDALKFLLGASALTVALSFVPVAFFLVYPFRLFVTFIHEGGHALATLLTFGAVDRVVIHPDASGETYSLGGASLLIASAGYLASTAYGAGLLVLCRQGGRAKVVLALTAAAILVLTAFFVNGLFGWLVGIGLSLGLVLVAVAAAPRAAHFFLSFLAVQCCLNALYDLQTLFFISARGGAASDAYNMYRLTWIPPVVWALSWLGISLAALAWALRSYRRSGL